LNPLFPIWKNKSARKALDMTNIMETVIEADVFVKIVSWIKEDVFVKTRFTG
jgi:hypothetical protein